MVDRNLCVTTPVDSEGLSRGTDRYCRSACSVVTESRTAGSVRCETGEVAADETDHVDHQVEIVQRERRTKGDDSAYWRCSCGESAGGRWYRSAYEAGKAADRNLQRHSS